MFGFSKKKKQVEQQSQPLQPAQSSQGNTDIPPPAINEEPAQESFEIPDFTEDDLNFDLGIGEFMPDQASSSGMGQQIPLNPMQSQSPADITGNNIPQTNEVQSFEGFPPVDENKAKEVTPSNKGEAPVEDENEIPKFEVPLSESLSDAVNDKKKKHEKKEAKPKRELIREMESDLMAQAKQRKEQAPPPSRGIFMQSAVYDKTVILMDDTIKKSSYGESIKSKLSSIMDSEKQHSDDLGKMSRAILESLLNCDARLFEKGDEK